MCCDEVTFSPFYQTNFFFEIRDNMTVIFIKKKNRENQLFMSIEKWSVFIYDS